MGIAESSLVLELAGRGVIEPRLGLSDMEFDPPLRTSVNHFCTIQLSPELRDAGVLYFSTDCETLFVVTKSFWVILF